MAKTRRPSNRRAFAIKQWPSFGRGPYSDNSAPDTVRSSPYFWWFRFLQLNEDYDAALAGQPSQIDPSIVAAFGHVRDVDFKTWWNAHVDLFAEPRTKYLMLIAETESDLVPIGATEAVNLVVPLDWNAKGLKKRFSEIVDKLVKEQRVRPAQKGFTIGEAPFKIGRKWNALAMEHAYRIYTLKKAAQQCGERLALADAAIRAKLPSTQGLRERDLNFKLRDKRYRLTIIAYRHYKRAEHFIASSVTRNFPA